mmetsp:Transcript_36619/g.88753  ORF Transcript_36619/g.88753 Transcript_36619/m.88753 type:complete len:525 (-) Transcript_36619:67-1641(-)
MGCFRRSTDEVQADNVEVEQGCSEKDSSEKVVFENQRSTRTSMLSSIKFTLSTILLIFSIVITMALMGTRQTQISKSLHPAVTIFLFWLVLIWMAAMEGSQTSLVGLVPVKKSRYGDSHPFAYVSTSYIHKDGNLERFIVGRQFLLVLAVFVTNLLAGSIENANVLGMPDILKMIFVNSGVALMLITVMVGQLMAQVNASRSMLDTINNCFVLYFVSYASMAIEASGLLHATYLVQIMYAKLNADKAPSEEPTKRTLMQQIFFWARVAFSCGLLVFAFATVLAALLAGKTTMWQGTPSFVSVILFLLLMIFAGMLEGMQIAILAVSKLPEEALLQHDIAKKSCDLVLQGDNLEAFLIGRQMLVTASMFVVARITGMAVEIGQGQNIFDVSDGVQETLFNSNILGAIVTTIASSLVWRVVASSSPIPFLSNRAVYYIIRLCLIVEASGLCSAASLLSKMQSKIFRFKFDEEYIGGEENELAVDLEHQYTGDSVESDTDSTQCDPAPNTTASNDPDDDDEFSVISI